MVLLALAGAALLGSGTGSAALTATSSLPTLSSPVFSAPSDSASGTTAVSGRISSPGGPYLYDSSGRVVFFHGVDAVYKYAPYELYPDKGKPWNLSVADASLMARLGLQRGAARHDLERVGAGHRPAPTTRPSAPTGPPAIRTSSTRPC